LNRLDFLTSRDERAAAASAAPRVTLADDLADREIALIRIRYRADRSFRRYHDLAAFTASFRWLWFHPTDFNADHTARDELAAMVFDAWPTVDWFRDHQIVVATGEVQAAPEAWEHGSIPEDDLAFGGGRAVYLAARTAVPA
jgi:hypothetical protein